MSVGGFRKRIVCDIVMGLYFRDREEGLGLIRLPGTGLFGWGYGGDCVLVNSTKGRQYSGLEVVRVLEVE